MWQNAVIICTKRLNECLQGKNDNLNSEKRKKLQKTLLPNFWVNVIDHCETRRAAIMEDNVK